MRVFSTKTSIAALTLAVGIAAPSLAYACDDHNGVSGTYQPITAASYTETNLGGQQLAYSVEPAQVNPGVRYRPTRRSPRNMCKPLLISTSSSRFIKPQRRKSLNAL